MTGQELASTIKFKSDYAKFDTTLGRLETWEASCERVFNMHLTKLGDKITSSPRLMDLHERALQAYKNKEVLASQRALQFGGEPILKKNARNFNCSASYLDRPRFFQEVFWILLCGCGAGYSVQRKDIDKLPDIAPRTKGALLHEVEDSIEGWADALGVLMSSYFTENQPFPEYAGYAVKFDYSKIRPEGSLISGGFKAPGHLGLKIALEKIETLIEKQLLVTNRLSPIVAHDITCFAADAVLSGGVRRSALICVFDKDDEEMLNAKVGQWWIDNPQRARANNSALLVRGTFTQEELNTFRDRIKQFGEPGFILADSDRVVFNPCVPGHTIVDTPDGPKKVTDLVGKQFTTYVAGMPFQSTDKGFIHTGYQDVYEVITDMGYKFKATATHKVQTKTETSHEYVTVDQLTIGDKLVLNFGDSENVVIDKDSIAFKQGWLLGSLVGDGNIEKSGTANLDFWGEDKQYALDLTREWLNDTYGVRTNRVGGEQVKQNKVRIGSRELGAFAESLGMVSGNKLVSDKVALGLNKHQTAGFLSGWFDADGSVQGTRTTGFSLRLASIQLEGLQVAQRMLLSLGISSTIRKVREGAERAMPDGKGGTALYNCKDSYELIISTRTNLALFNKLIGLRLPSKQMKMTEVLATYTKTYDITHYPKVVAITYAGKEDVYDCTIPGPAMFGANGLLVSNCAEIGFTCYSPITGLTGWGFCNLNEINGAKPKTPEQFFNICELSAYMGTVQASYTDMPYLTQATKEIVEYEALLGISITGWMDNPSLLFDPEVLAIGAQIVREVNKEVADLIGIRQAARTTCSKPSGNASVILGSASGMKPQHSHKYFRLMRMNKNGEVIQYIKDKAPSMVVDCDGSDTDYVLYIPITLPDTALVEGQLSAVEFLEKVALAKKYWVDEGKNPGLSLYEGTSHNISNTVTVRTNEWEDVFKYIFDHQEVFSGISFISDFGDKEYNQAPFTAVPTLESLVRQYGIGAVFASGLITDGLHLFDDLWVALNKYVLNNVKFVGTRQQTLLMADWVKRVKQFAKKYTKGNLVKTVHLLLDVNHMHLWENINRELPALDNIEEVTFVPEYIAVDTLGAASCFGGACEIPSR